MAALNIKNEEAYNLVKELADLRGESMTMVVIHAVREQLKREHPDLQRQGLANKLLELGRETAPLWREPWRSTPHGDLLYDENGLPK
ncbi:MAG: type II toxin-antitoxin system VapB family antitoxin [Chloroflexota bacterium]|nr:type II toxin-antitoxin system VapB family antitoxin [Chloroflexota bacterium]